MDFFLKQKRKPLNFICNFIIWTEKFWIKKIGDFDITLLKLLKKAFEDNKLDKAVKFEIWFRQEILIVFFFTILKNSLKYLK